MFTLPGTNYCGPFNAMDNEVMSELDEICRRHDVEYEIMGNKAYVYFNYADQQMLDEIENRMGWRESVIRAVWNAKKTIAPHMHRTKYLLKEALEEKANKRREIADNIAREHGVLFADMGNPYEVGDDNPLEDYCTPYDMEAKYLNEDEGGDVVYHANFIYKRGGSAHPAHGLRPTVGFGLHKKTLRKASGLKRR